MAEPQFSTHPDDDLPRTIRREKDARQRSAAAASSHGGGYGTPPPGRGYELPTADGVTVSRFDIPFFRLMFFLIKCVLAGVPAVLLLGAMLFGLGQALKIFLPWLVKMQIVVTFPS